MCKFGDSSRGLVKVLGYYKLFTVIMLVDLKQIYMHLLQPVAGGITFWSSHSCEQDISRTPRGNLVQTLSWTRRRPDYIWVDKDQR